ncbi:hypothetical protein HAX54_031862 [Datura stramonium]|uniref:Uncharacterized protein n=1 Tax=Datura stramonium TaxID=4076 RepID=A0ABS8SC73_DATST|nr:hypothetical protein [Datura stramonium]
MDSVTLMTSAAKSLAGFNMASKTTKGEITLSANTEGVERATHFNILDGEISYNVILDRSWIHFMRVVPSNYNHVLKFPMPTGIRQIRDLIGDDNASSSQVR